MRTENVPYQADGLSMVGHLVWDETAAGKRPGVLLFPEAFGLGAHAKGEAERVAKELGYVALAADLHGNQAIIQDVPKVMGEIGQLRSSALKVRARVTEAYKVLAARPEVDASRIAALGYCFGGTMAFELALTGIDLKAAVGFHSGLAVTSPGDAKNIKGKIMALIGADDPVVSAEERANFEAVMRAGGVDWQMTLYGGVVHSYTNPAADRMNRPEFAHYDPKANERSFRQMSNLLAEVFA